MTIFTETLSPGIASSVTASADTSGTLSWTEAEPSHLGRAGNIRDPEKAEARHRDRAKTPDSDQRQRLCKNPLNTFICVLYAHIHARVYVRVHVFFRRQEINVEGRAQPLSEPGACQSGEPGFACEPQDPLSLPPSPLMGSQPYSCIPAFLSTRMLGWNSAHV